VRKTERERKRERERKEERAIGAINFGDDQFLIKKNSSPADTCTDLPDLESTPAAAAARATTWRVGGILCAHLAGVLV